MHGVVPQAELRGLEGEIQALVELLLGEGAARRQSAARALVPWSLQRPGPSALVVQCEGHGDVLGVPGVRVDQPLVVGGLSKGLADTPVVLSLIHI